MKSKTEISNLTRRRVLERDSYEEAPCCVFCGSPRGLELHHVVPRSLGGMGVESNLVTLCSKCHQDIDTAKGGKIREYVEAYLILRYPGWSRKAQIYFKE